MVLGLDVYDVSVYSMNSNKGLQNTLSYIIIINTKYDLAGDSSLDSSPRD